MREEGNSLGTEVAVSAGEREKWRGGRERESERERKRGRVHFFLFFSNAFVFLFLSPFPSSSSSLLLFFSARERRGDQEPSLSALVRAREAEEGQETGGPRKRNCCQSSKKRTCLPIPLLSLLPTPTPSAPRPRPARSSRACTRRTGLPLLRLLQLRRRVGKDES